MFENEEMLGKEENFYGGRGLFLLRLLIPFVSMISLIFISNNALNRWKLQFLAVPSIYFLLEPVQRNLGAQALINRQWPYFSCKGRTSNCFWLKFLVRITRFIYWSTMDGHWFQIFCEKNHTGSYLRSKTKCWLKFCASPPSQKSIFFCCYFLQFCNWFWSKSSLANVCPKYW